MRFQFSALLLASALAAPTLAEDAAAQSDPDNTQAPRLSIERLFSDPALAGTAPKQLKLAPDGERVTFIRAREEDYNRFDLWEYHVASGKTQMLVDSALLHSGEEQLSDEEKARRERQRVYGQGILEYQWSPQSDALLFPLAGDVYYYRLGAGEVSRLVNTPTFETDVKFSPQGSYISFVREQDLYVLEIATGKETRLTQDGGGTIKNGMAEFVAQEEMGRMTGYWWAPDETRVAFTRIDESPVLEVVRNEIYADEVKLFEQRYPATGTANVLIQLGVVSLADGATQWLDLGEEKDIYLPRVKWLRSSRFLSYQWQSRDQQTLKLNFADTQTGKQQTVLTEIADTWINLHNDLYFLKDRERFIWASERDGYKHLYLYHVDGTQLAQLTQGAWVVDKLEAVDEQTGQVYFTGRKDTPLEKHLYRVEIAQAAAEGEESVRPITRVSQRDGFHRITFAKNASRYVNSYSRVDQPPQVSLHDADGSLKSWLAENQLNADHPLTPYLAGFAQPEFGELAAVDRQTLHYRLFKPVSFDPQQRYPVIVRVYGGPHAQLVTNSWSNHDLFTQYLQQQGFIVFQLDNRGSYNRGKQFEDPIYRKLGEVEVEDQIRGVEYLRSLSYVDPERIGIYGHSYGGYMALMAMFKAGEYFQAGVSGAPVTDWRLYDTHYTERYLDHPDANAEGYDNSAVFPFAPALKSDLLIYHGMADDNVLFTHSTKLYKQLQDSALRFEMMNYPGSKHSLRGKKVRTHLYGTIAEFFQRSLGTPSE